MDSVRVAVTGAAGQIAYQLIFSLLKGEVFGDRAIHLHLIDIEPALANVKGVMMEIEDCAFERLTSVQGFASDQLDQGFKAIDFAFLIGASPRKAGMERSDLLEKNGEIFKEQGEALSQYAKSSVEVLVVGNPCNTNCLIASHHAKNIPSEQFFAMTMLDENRARMQIAIKEGVALADVGQCFIYGNHSATQYPDYENTKHSVDMQDAWWQDDFVPIIQTRGAAVIKARGASSAASAAHAAIKTAHFIVSKSKASFSVARVSSGEYGSPEGLVVSMPTYFDGNGWQTDTKYQHSEIAKRYIEASYQELQSEYEQVKVLGFIDD